DSAAVRAPGRPNPGIDPSGHAGVAGSDPVRVLGAPRPGAERREAPRVVPGLAQADDRSADGEAGAGSDLLGGDHPDPSGEREWSSLASQCPAQAGEAGAGLPGAVRGGIHTVSHKFQLSTRSIRETGVPTRTASRRSPP